MSNQIRISMQTRKKWLLDVALLAGGILAALSGIYFLFLPSGGYEGGRNLMYGITILFSRHTWGGLLMMVVAVVHFSLHWGWVEAMFRRAKNVLLSRGARLSRFAKFNVALNLLVGVSFLVCALSGVYFLLAPSGGFQGGRNPSWDPNFLFSRTTWDLMHTWSGVVMIAAATVHFGIHWQWGRLLPTSCPMPCATLLPRGHRCVYLPSKRLARCKSQWQTTAGALPRKTCLMCSIASGRPAEGGRRAVAWG